MWILSLLKLSLITSNVVVILFSWNVEIKLHQYGAGFSKKPTANWCYVGTRDTKCLSILYG